MKKLRILSLLFVAVFVLTTFSGTFVFADNESEDETVVVDTTDETVDEDTTDEETSDEATDEEGTDEETPEEGGEGTTPPADDRTTYTVDMFTPVDPADEANKFILTAAEKAAGGRAVTVYSITLAAALAVESSSDYVGLCTYDEAAQEMTMLTPFYEGAYTQYNLENLDGVTGYVLEVASISESDIANLPNMDRTTRFQWKLDKRGLFKTADQRVRAMTKYYEDDKVVLYADDELAELAVYNKVNGEYFFSTPYDYRRVQGVTATTTKSQIASILELEYYDNSANKKPLYSFTDAVEKTFFEDPNDEESYDNIQFSTEAIENGVRFNMQVGTTQVDSLLPYAAEATRFETKVLEPVQKMADEGHEVAKVAMRKLKAYYRRYHYADLSASMQQSLSANYPGIKEYDLYVLRGVTNREKKFLSEYVKLSGQYTWADWENDLEISGYVPDDVALALFEIKVDFTIENGDLVVNMPTDKITYDKENFTLATVTLMRYFGAGTYTDPGFVFMPDGSGSVINFNNDGSKNSAAMIKPVYGDDYAMTTTTSYMNLSQAAYLPVFGLHTNNRGFLAILEKGDAMATAKSETGGSQSPYEAAYATFVYNTVQTITYADGSKQNGDFTYYNENTYKGGYKIRYKLLYGEDVTYVDMAKTYRQYLLDNGRLVEKVNVSNGNVPLVLETLGLIDKKASFLGFIYDKKIPLTTFEAAQSMMDELAAGGVNNVALRYRGWMNGGLNYSVPSSMDIESKLGGDSAFADLISYMSGKKYSFFPEVDFRIVRRDGVFDGYTTTSNAPKMTDRTTVTLTPRNELDNVMEIDKNYFAIAPASLDKYFGSFFDDYNEFKANSVSLGTIGNMLYSDFNSGSNAAHRQRALELLQESVKKYATDGKMDRIMVEGGNAYTYGYATDIVDIPLTDSSTFLADSAVPFMQIVLHGHIQYAGTALNLSDNMTDTILKSAEYGANLHFTLSAENTRELKDTVYSNYFTIDFDTWKEDVLNLYEKFNKVFAPLQDKEIEDHEAVADLKNVFITTYEDGTRIAVNYNRTDVTVEGKTIAAQDFIVL